MDGQAGEESYVDEELDRLPDEAYNDLERHAYTATQHDGPAGGAASSDYGDIDDEMLDGEILNAEPQPPVEKWQYGLENQNISVNSQHRSRQPESHTERPVSNGQISVLEQQIAAVSISPQEHRRADE